MNWLMFWERHRVAICRWGGLLLLVIAQPRSQVFYLLGLLVALLGEALRFWAAGHIRKAEELARTGPYAWVRNPLYLGSFVMSCGVALMCTSTTRWLSSLVIWAAVLATFRWPYAQKIRLEEEDLRGRFGDAFEQYRLAVPAFFAAPSGLRAALREGGFSWALAVKNKELKTLWALLGLAVVLRIKMAYRL